jgi:hypothetical protein
VYAIVDPVTPTLIAGPVGDVGDISIALPPPMLT